ncbi:spore coat protein CotJB [Blautia sp. AM47-4]|uniref:spore coat protein CotJB n=1 Tax=Blautia sp. AM47-4 TaxID=2292979 RepID=UPI0026A1A449|nr:spore coat protein CotJB [Blautia sp. AM47-4]
MMPQMPSREKLLAWIDQVSFAVVEMNLYLDTHPEDEDALAFFREKWRFEKKH